jgi:hypothetical protein
MSVAAAERLHVIAHRVMLESRDFDDWWDSPLETAFATVDLARHTHAHWVDAKRALGRVLRWWRDDQARRTSADVAALALAARAAAELQQQDPKLVEAAIDAVDDLAQRDPSIVPKLHLALCAWALDPLVTDREAAPWPALRARSEQAAQIGVDQAIKQYIVALTHQPFDAAWLVQELISGIGATAGPSDTCILIWLITAACEKIPLFLPRDDNAFQILIRRRSEFSDRLAGEIDEITFRGPENIEFDEDDLEIAPPPQTYLSSFEALLLDFAFASREEAEPWLTYREASKLFGEDAAAARIELGNMEHRFLRIVGTLIGFIGITASVILWLTMRNAGLNMATANPAAVALTALMFSIATGVTFRGHKQGPFGEPLGIFFASLALLATAVAINQTLRSPFISDVGGLTVGTLVAALAAVLWAIIKRSPKSPQG